MDAVVFPRGRGRRRSRAGRRKLAEGTSLRLLSCPCADGSRDNRPRSSSSARGAEQGPAALAPGRAAATPFKLISIVGAVATLAVLTALLIVIAVRWVVAGDNEDAVEPVVDGGRSAEPLPEVTSREMPLQAKSSSAIGMRRLSHDVGCQSNGHDRAKPRREQPRLLQSRRIRNERARRYALLPRPALRCRDTECCEVRRHSYG